MLSSYWLLIPALLFTSCQSKRNAPKDPKETASQEVPKPDELPGNPIGRPEIPSPTVNPADVTSFKITSAAMLENLTVSSRVQLEGEIRHKSGIPERVADVIWDVEPKTLATINADGYLETKVQPGTVKITARFGEKTAVMELTIKDKASTAATLSFIHVSLKDPAASLLEGGELSLIATGTFDDRTERQLNPTWSVKAVDGAAEFITPGILRLTAPGKVVVEAKSLGITDELELMIVAKPQPIVKLEISGLPTRMGDEPAAVSLHDKLPLGVTLFDSAGQKVPPTEIVWEVFPVAGSSGQAVMEGSVLMPKAVGQVQLKATSQGKSETRLLNIVSIDKLVIKKEVSYLVDRLEEISVNLLLSDAQLLPVHESVSWTFVPPSNDPGFTLQSVTDTGRALIQATKPGKVTIRAVYRDGYQAEAELEFVNVMFIDLVEFVVHESVGGKLKAVAKLESSETLPEYVRTCEKKVRQTVSSFLKNPRALKKFDDLAGAKRKLISMVKVQINTVQNGLATQADFAAVDRDAYFWYQSYDRSRSQPILAFENFESGSWIFEAIALESGCILPNEKEVARYMDYVIKRLNK
jgi:hypothetical protein